MDVIKGYVKVNDAVEREEMRYVGEVLTERQKNQMNNVDVVLFIEIL